MNTTTPETAIDDFARNLKAVSGHPHLVADHVAAAEAICRIIADAAPRCVAVAQIPAAILARVEAHCAEHQIEFLKEPYPAGDLPGLIDRAEIGITGAAFAIAETGTLAEVCTNDAVRIVSGLPRTHIGIVDGNQMLLQLLDAAPRIREAIQEHPKGVTLSFISGPSRTGDIEMVLTLGVHGPETMHAVVIGGGHGE